MSNILELFGKSVKRKNDWVSIIETQICPFTNRKCFKVRKSQPEISIGTCTVCYGKEKKYIVICPNRLLESHRVFIDCIHLLSRHEPGNDFHIIPEITIPGGSVDYFLVSAKNDKVKDFVAIEFQTLDTTGTVWPERQKLLLEKNILNVGEPIENKSFGMNWKMTAKTILVQLHHKIQTLEYLSKHLVLIIQDHFLGYIERGFDFSHLSDPPINSDPMHFHSYVLNESNNNYFLSLNKRLSTDSDGIGKCLGLQSESKIELSIIIENLERKMSDKTRMKLI